MINIHISASTRLREILYNTVIFTRAVYRKIVNWYRRESQAPVRDAAREKTAVR